MWLSAKYWVFISIVQCINNKPLIVNMFNVCKTVQSAIYGMNL